MEPVSSRIARRLSDQYQIAWDTLLEKLKHRPDSPEYSTAIKACIAAGVPARSAANLVNVIAYYNEGELFWLRRDALEKNLVTPVPEYTAKVIDVLRARAYAHLAEAHALLEAESRCCVCGKAVVSAEAASASTPRKAQESFYPANEEFVTPPADEGFVTPPAERIDMTQNSPSRETPASCILADFVSPPL